VLVPGRSASACHPSRSLPRLPRMRSSVTSTRARHMERTSNMHALVVARHMERGSIHALVSPATWQRPACSDPDPDSHATRVKRQAARVAARAAPPTPWLTTASTSSESRCRPSRRSRLITLRPNCVLHAARRQRCPLRSVAFTTCANMRQSLQAQALSRQRTTASCRCPLAIAE
jgi:hypothetical protein